LRDGSFEASPLQEILLRTKTKKDKPGHSQLRAKDKLAKILVFRQQQPAVAPRLWQHFCVGRSGCGLRHLQCVMPGAAKPADERRINALVDEPAHRSDQR
jgi:hypothetical protein